MYQTSKQIAKRSKSSFYYAFSLLPEEKRDAMNNIYAFCRTTDDIVDSNDYDFEIKYEKLHKWRIELEKALNGTSNYGILNKTVHSIKRFNIPVEPFFDLIHGMEMDLQIKTYPNFEDLLSYCYKVASTVGLMCIEIFGYKHESTKDYAVNLGYALQLTNILRDVKKDAEIGRIYLPEEDLEKFNYSKSELKNGIYNDNFKNLMKFEVQRAKYYFNKADNSLAFEDKRSMFAARAMQHIYFKLLQKIERKNFDVISNDIRVSKFEKVAIALGVWMKYSLVY